jgi:hypothetical protein
MYYIINIRLQGVVTYKIIRSLNMIKFDTQKEGDKLKRTIKGKANIMFTNYLEKKENAIVEFYLTPMRDIKLFSIKYKNINKKTISKRIDRAIKKAQKKIK